MGSRRDFVQGRTTVRLAGAMLVLAGLLCVPALGACSSAGPVNFSGNLDLVYVTRPNETGINFNMYGENPFHSARIRLFADAPIQDHVHVFTEFFYDDDAMFARLFGGFVRLSDPKGRDLHLEAGKIPLHVGAFPNRSYAHKNNLIGSPLMYQYKTDVRNDQVPTTAEDIVANRGLGYRTSFLTPGLTGVGYEGGSATPGMYENCWGCGLWALGTARASGRAFRVGRSRGDTTGWSSTLSSSPPVASLPGTRTSGSGRSESDSSLRGAWSPSSCISSPRSTSLRPGSARSRRHSSRWRSDADRALRSRGDAARGRARRGRARPRGGDRRIGRAHARRPRDP